MQINNWDQKFIGLAKHIATWSKDQSTKVGSVIVGEDMSILATGYNGIPRGCNDSDDRQVRPLKYQYFSHAETNAICNAASVGTKLKDSTIYVTMFPCVDCARNIIQCGIKRIVCPEADLNNENWKESFKISIELLNEAQIIIEYII